MEVKLANAGLLTNIEVLDILNERKANRNSKHGIATEMQSSIRMESQAISYIEDTAIGSQTSECIRNKLSATKRMGLDLTEGEMVMIANHAPTQPVEIHMIVEECAERIDEENIEKLIGIWNTSGASD